MNSLEVLLILAVIIFEGSCKPYEHYNKYIKEYPVPQTIEDCYARYRTNQEFCRTIVKNAEDSKVSKILGGTVAEEGQFPYIVSLEDYSHQCGGSAIADYWVLSAAHCFTHQYVNIRTIRAGSLKSGEGGKIFPIKKVIIHPKFGEGAFYENDIALIRICKSLRTVPKLKYIDLPQSDDDVQPKEVVTAAGWGFTSSDSHGPSEELRYVNLITIGNTECNSSKTFECLRNISDDLQITKNMLCTATKGKDTCKGDSGGPLVKQIEGKTVLVGVMSYGEGAGKLTSPGVYTRVSQYTSWIQKHIGIQTRHHKNK